MGRTEFLTPVKYEVFDEEAFDEGGTDDSMFKPPDDVQNTTIMVEEKQEGIIRKIEDSEIKDGM